MFKKIRKLASAAAVYLWKNVPFPAFVRKYGTICTNRRFLAAVQGIIVNEKGEVLIFKHTYRKTPWGIPGGWLSYEQPDVGLQREVFEESGFKIVVKEIAKVSYVSNVYGVKAINILMLGRYAGGEFLPSVEVSEHMFCQLDHWPVGMREDQKELIRQVFRDRHELFK